MTTLDDFIEECLNEHNARRALHGAPPLKHSRALDKTAQDWAEVLISEDCIRNSPLSSRGEIGESINMRTSTAARVDVQGSEVVNQWYSDMKNYNFSDGKGPAGNFTQLVWNATREVGFGKTRAAGKCVVVAHYRPPGNVRGRYLDNVAPPLSGNTTQLTDQAPSERSANDTAATRSVVTETITDPHGKKYMVRREIVESVEADGHIRRSVNETYSDPSESRRDITDAIRFSRSSDLPKTETLQRTVDSRQSTDGADDFAESVTRAHNVYRLRHNAPDLKLDPHLSKMAQDWADYLVNQDFLSNSGITYQGIRLGENVFSRWSNTLNRITGQEVVDHWYQEVSKYEPGSEPESIQGIGSFTQLVWTGSQCIGVAFAAQPKNFAESPLTMSAKFIVVCFYYPPGNVTGQFKTNVKFAAK
ncbi:unnamed protein product [Dicrocoelium dendriticum]|nr:unnamed protein product [Dicrocoelium dendriticum]